MCVCVCVCVCVCACYSEKLEKLTSNCGAGQMLILSKFSLSKHNIYVDIYIAKLHFSSILHCDMFTMCLIVSLCVKSS